jgi:serine/threonine protein kinase/HAMP domain-containing protein
LVLEKVGRYRVEDKIGEGAMADVYRAYDPSIHRTLAIKVLKPEFSQIREYAARFLREAKAAGALNHPNIVTIYDVGEVDGYPYIAMELIDGKPLNDVVSAHSHLSADDVTAIGLQLADALQYAHGQGVVHRDIKPSNIMVLKDGRTVRILDFGIARMAEAADQIFNESDSLKTQIGQVLGSPRYMSPEQALGQEIDGRSDLFSVGVVLYELLSGEKAFSGASAATLALQITSQDPTPLGKVAPTTSRGLQFVVDKLMAKRPDRRFQSGAQLADALRREQSASEAIRAEANSIRRFLPLPVRAMLLVVTITTIVMVLSIVTVLNRQYAAMQHMALTSGTAVASFVANNAAFTLISNSAVPPDQRDWAPIQGFVQNAGKDPNVLSMSVTDADGVVRGARDVKLLGRPEPAAEKERLVSRTPDQTVTETSDKRGFRFRRRILYGDHPVGEIDLLLSRADLRSTAALSQLLMVVLALVTLGSVGGASYVVARNLASPIRRLRAALADVASGDLSFRISHSRKDEFGDLFEAFNLMAAQLEERMADAMAPMPARAVVTSEDAPLTEGPFARPEAPASSEVLAPVEVLPSKSQPAGVASARSPRKRTPPAASDAPVAASEGPQDDADRTIIRARRPHVVKP